MASNKKNALGKGLSALLPAGSALTKGLASDDESERVLNIETDKLLPNKQQPRKSFNKDALDELAASIKENGMLQPIIAVKSGEKYKIVAGERRWRAAKSLNLRKVPVIVRTYEEGEILRHALIENIQREDLNSIEAASALEKLMEEHGMTQEELAAAVGKSRSAVANSLRLLKLSPEVIKMVRDGLLSAGHARAILPINNAKLQKEAAGKIISNSMSVRAAERLVKRILKDMKKPAPLETENNVLPADSTNEQYMLSIKNMEEKLENKMGTRVKLKERNKKGEIIIEYYSVDDRERLFELLLK